MNDYAPLLEALEGHFEQSLDELPDALRRPVAELFYPLRWDDCDPDCRRRFVERFDIPPAPETTEDERQSIDNLRARKVEYEQEIIDLEKIQSLSVSDLELKKAKVAEAKGELEKIELQICEARGDYLEADDDAAPSSPCQSVYAAQIISNFRVFKDEDQNEEWWKSKMREANRNGLGVCRVGKGKRGPGGSIWRPDLIAFWLVDQDKKGFDGMSSTTATSALKKFPDCAEADDVYLQSDE